MSLTVRREPIDDARYVVLDRLYSVWLGDVRIGEVGRDDVDPVEPGSPRHLWHAWLDPFPCEDDGFGLGGWDEAVGSRALTRWEAVAELVVEFNRLTESLGLVERAP